MLASQHPGEECSAGEEDVGHELGVLLPVDPVLLRAAHLVAGLAVDNHGGEEGRVEERQRRRKPTSQAPGGRHNNISRVLHLTSKSIPASDQQVTLRGFDVRDGLLEDAPGYLWEGIGTTIAHLAGRFLTVCRVKNIVT